MSIVRDEIEKFYIFIACKARCMIGVHYEPLIGLTFHFDYGANICIDVSLYPR